VRRAPAEANTHVTEPCGSRPASLFLSASLPCRVKQGGSTNPATNTMLASALAFAKQIGAPKDSD